MSRTSSRLLRNLANARDQVTTDKTNQLGTGTRFEASVWIDQVTAEVSVDEVVQGVGHVEKFSLEGRWASHVRKDSFQLGRLYDKVWGDHERPYGFFSVTAEALDGEIAGKPEIEVIVEDAGSEPKDFALEHANTLIRSTILEFVG
jgi:hypothetical protein